MQKFWKLQVCFVKKIPIVYLFELLRLIQFWQNFSISFNVHRFSPFAYLWSYDDYELYKNTNICYRLIFGSQRFNVICNGIILNSARNFIKEISVRSFPACIWNLFFLLLCDKTGSKQLQIFGRNIILLTNNKLGCPEDITFM